MSWSPTQYTRFEDERSRPARDLVAAIPRSEAAVAIDIGCGPGNSTELLAARYPGARVIGLDNSPDMIAAAQKRLPGLAFRLADIAAWDDPGPFDVILANAALQWVPDHERLVPQLVAKLAAGGCLAVQMPDNLDEPAHRLMREVAETGPWAGKLADATKARSGRYDAAWYYATLRSVASKVDIWRTIYHHPLAGGPAAIVAWFQSTGLRPFLAPLTKPEQAEFLATYEATLKGAYATFEDGTVLLPFPRLFFVAVR